MKKLIIIISFFTLSFDIYSQEYSLNDLVNQVRESETEFAKTMLERDFNKFLEFISDEAIFLSCQKALYGKSEIAKYWEKYYVEKEPPFTWEPDIVEVLPSGKLALSNGLVFVNGKLVSKFSSTWRLEEDGKWRVVFDHGYKICD